MKVLKFTPLLLIAFLAYSCSSSASDDATKSADSSSTTSATKGDAPAKEKKATAPIEKTVTIPAGTEITVILSSTLNSGKNKAGDPFEGGLAAPISVDGKTVIDRGVKVVGKVVDAEGSGRVKGLADMRLALTGIVNGGQTVPVTTAPFEVEAASTKGRDTAVVAGGAGLGAVIGAIAGGGKGAATGAVIGGAAGGGTVLATKGKEVNFPAESKVTFKLADPLTIKQ